MNFSLIICTYCRPGELLNLLESVKSQTKYPDEILVIDGAEGDVTKILLQKVRVPNLKYYKAGPRHQGLTKQRNYGVSRVSPTSDVICFLDDDTILTPSYFEVLLSTYKTFPDALGVSGYISNEVEWRKAGPDNSADSREFLSDGWLRKEGKRFSLRRNFLLQPDEPPGFMPDFSHGYSIDFLPPSGKIYEVELLKGGITSYKKTVFQHHRFSTFFQGYGLYEDVEFSLRISRLGKLYVNTNAKLEHHPAAKGRPKRFSYGNMVVRNGWYVWRMKNPDPSLQARIKWNATCFLLTVVRFGNCISGKQRKEAFFEALGRIAGWGGLLYNRPRLKL